jgi:glycosyltransferase involved in cell wall biosynthesis
MNALKIGVIISTYNNPQWLEKTLWGYMSQKRPADEIIIADDGSGPDTRRLIEKYSTVLPIKHVWHEDCGFCKTTILNKAILAADSEYLIFTDQDCIPREDFIYVHEYCAAKGSFLSGGYFKLPMNISQSITKDDISSGRAFSLRWLISKGINVKFKMTKLFRSSVWSRMMNSITPARATWNGMNSSGWKSDIVATNGFDERMKYGGEDRELGERLVNAGICPRQIRYSAITLHLDHQRPYRNAEARRINDEIRRATKLNHATKTDFSIFAQSMLNEILANGHKDL